MLLYIKINRLDFESLKRFVYRMPVRGIKTKCIDDRMLSNYRNCIIQQRLLCLNRPKFLIVQKVFVFDLYNVLNSP